MLISIIIGFSFNIYAKDFKLFELNELYFHYKNFKNGGRNPLIDNAKLESEIDQELSLIFNTDLLHFFYFDRTKEFSTLKYLIGTII